MKKFIVSLLVLALAPINALAGNTFPVEQQYLQSTSILTDPGFENGKDSWQNFGGGTFSILSAPSANVDVGQRSASYTGSATNDRLQSKLIAIPSGYYGRKGVVGCEFKCNSGTCNYQVVAASASNGSSDIGTAQTITSSTTEFIRTTQFFDFPGSGSIEIDVRDASGVQPTVFVDSCFISLYQPQPTYVAPTVTKLFAGSGTYTSPTNPRPIYLRVRIVGGGGGGGGVGSGNTGGSGGIGGTSSFGTSLISCTGGLGGNGTGTSTGGAGGTASLNAPAVGISIDGSNGLAMLRGTTTVSGGCGGATPFGGAGCSRQISGGSFFTGEAASMGSGSGGSGGSSDGTVSSAGAGGAGAFIDAIVPNPATSYPYTVGAGGTAGTAGTAGNAGGAGGEGVLLVEEHYQ